MKQKTAELLTPGWSNKIRAAAAERNVNMSDISTKFGVVVDTVSKVFRGAEDASFELAFQVSEFLGTPFLLGRGPRTDRRVVYVASRYAGDISANIMLNQAYCRNVLEEGCLPISPHLALAFLDEDTERETALDLCKNLIDLSDEVRFYVEFGKSSGMKFEEDYARKRGKLVLFVG